MAPPTNLDVVCQTYVEMVLGNLVSDTIRPSRQWSNFRANGDEVALDSKGTPPVCPGADRAIPTVPSGLASRRPRLWMELPPAGAAPQTPKRLGL